MSLFKGDDTDAYTSHVTRIEGGLGAMLSWRSALASVQQGNWITEQRIRVYPRICLCIWLAGLLWLLSSPFGKPWAGADFVVYWVPAHLAGANHQTAIYNPSLLSQFEQAESGQPGIYLPFPYPPTFLLLILPLGKMPFWAAFFSLELASLLAYGALVYKLVGTHGLTLAFAFPGLAICVYNGHFEILLAVCFGLAMLFLDAAPYVAGVLIAICSVKPHLFLMVPLALIAGRYWKVLWSAIASTVLFGVAAAIAFGPRIWQSFALSMYSLGKELSMHQSGSTPTTLAKQQSILAFAIRNAGLDAAVMLQIVTVGFAAWAVLTVWKNDDQMGRRVIILCASTLLAAPYLFDYDLVLLSIPMAVLTNDGLKNGFLPWQKSLLSALWIAPALARISTFYCDFPLAFVVLSLSVVLAVHEFKSDGTASPRRRGAQAAV